MLAGVPALAGVPNQSANGYFTFLEMHISPPKAGNARHPQGVSLEYHLLSGNDLTGQFPEGRDMSRLIEIRLAKGMRVNYRAFPACNYGRLARIGPPACPGRSKVGVATALADFRPVIPNFFGVTCSAFNGRDSHHAPALLAWCKTDFGASGTLTYDILHGTRTSGPRLRLDNGPTPPSGLSIRYFSADLTISSAPITARGKRVSFLDAPDSCHGSWAFSQVTTDYKGRVAVVADRQPCIP